MESSPEELKQKWYDHFEKILNISSQYQQEVIEEMPAHPVCSEMDSSPTLDKLFLALCHLKQVRQVAGLGSCLNYSSMEAWSCKIGY